jgi:hypothetical protein
MISVTANPSPIQTGAQGLSEQTIMGAVMHLVQSEAAKPEKSATQPQCLRGAMV